MLIQLNNCDFNIQTSEWDEVTFRDIRGYLFVTLCDGDRVNYIVFNSEEQLLGVESYEWPDWIPSDEEVIAKYKQ